MLDRKSPDAEEEPQPHQRYRVLPLPWLKQKQTVEAFSDDLATAMNKVDAEGGNVVSIQFVDDFGVLLIADYGSNALSELLSNAPIQTIQIPQRRSASIGPRLSAVFDEVQRGPRPVGAERVRTTYETVARRCLRGTSVQQLKEDQVLLAHASQEHSSECKHTDCELGLAYDVLGEILETLIREQIQ
jgi:hypothetical protein